MRALLHCPIVRQVGVRQWLKSGSDCAAEFFECRSNSQVRVWGVGAEFVLAASKVLDERATFDHNGTDTPTCMWVAVVGLLRRSVG